MSADMSRDFDRSSPHHAGRPASAAQSIRFPPGHCAMSSHPPVFSSIRDAWYREKSARLAGPRRMVVHERRSEDSAGWPCAMPGLPLGHAPSSSRESLGSSP